MRSIICLMGPTASGKTPLAVELVQQYPLDIISVDSAMVYRGMDIGTAKPDQETLEIASHRLIDIADPAESYSAGSFREDALREINDIHLQGRTPLLVGGTMMYFNVLRQGIASLPSADKDLREKLLQRIEAEGLSSLYAELQQIDSAAAQRINPNDVQRIQRALEVFYLTGKPISVLQKEGMQALEQYHIHYVALVPVDRAGLHKKIEKRFDLMLQQGFIEEVEALFAREDLSATLPSIRSVGYRQAWAYLAGEINKSDMREKAIAATRQLAKRQLTWLRSWPDLHCFNSELGDLHHQVSKFAQGVLQL